MRVAVLSALLAIFTEVFADELPVPLRDDDPNDQRALLSRDGEVSFPGEAKPTRAYGESVMNDTVVKVVSCAATCRVVADLDGARVLFDTTNGQDELLDVVVTAGTLGPGGADGIGLAVGAGTQLIGDGERFIYDGPDAHVEGAFTGKIGKLYHLAPAAAPLRPDHDVLPDTPLLVAPGGAELGTVMGTQHAVVKKSSGEVALVEIDTSAGRLRGWVERSAVVPVGGKPPGAPPPTHGGKVPRGAALRRTPGGPIIGALLADHDGEPTKDGGFTVALGNERLYTDGKPLKLSGK
jgi:hypothetical protein